MTRKETIYIKYTKSVAHIFLKIFLLISIGFAVKGKYFSKKLLTREVSNANMILTIRKVSERGETIEQKKQTYKTKKRKRIYSGRYGKTITDNESYIW